MARRTTPPPTPQPARLSLLDIQLALPRLERRIEEVEAFSPHSLTKDTAPAAATALQASIEEALVQSFGHNTVEFVRYAPAAQFEGALRYTSELPVKWLHDSLTNQKSKSLALLTQAVRALRDRIGETTVPVIEFNFPEPEGEGGRKVFIVHGRDTGARESVARFLEHAGFEPVVLHEQANQGRTIIEKFEDHSAANFAVVLLTPDDVGGMVGGTMNPRARQNVVLELGYFIGKLGRGRVCALKSGNIELPSDILGVAWTSFDESGGWKASLAKELQAAGFEIDWNKVMV